MCGVWAAIVEKENPVTFNPLAKLLTMRHRGPDALGVKNVELSWCNVVLGMTRLAIVDLSSQDVPFSVPYDSAVLAFNGEIYNWRELREELSDGTPWATNCDTEVLIRGWRKWGTNVLQRLNGMFAFVLVDPSRDSIFVARDRAGEKPLYRAMNNDGVFFASEIKALPVELVETFDPEAEVLEFDFRSTPFQAVVTVAPGSYFVLTAPRLFEERFWWTFPSFEDFDKKDRFENIHQAVGQLAEVLVDAVRLRSTCEVKVGLQLSGGLDSSIIHVACADPAQRYTVSFLEEGYNNLDLVKDLGPTKAVTFGPTLLAEALPAVAYHLDTPATWSAVCQWFMFEQMSKDGVKVTLSGEGADELFHGYSRYRYLWHVEQAKMDGLLQGYKATADRVFGTDDDLLARLLNRGTTPESFERAKFFVSLYSGTGNLVDRMARLEWHTTMQCLLRMPDRMSSAFSLENRAPFLDSRVIDISARIPADFKIDPKWTKAVLRLVAEKLGVPYSITRATHKRGLALPWKAWFGGKDFDRAGFSTRMRDTWRGVFWPVKDASAQSL